MPIWLRNFTFQKISDFYDKEKAEMEKAKGKSKLHSGGARGPNIKSPSYTAKARK